MQKYRVSIYVIIQALQKHQKHISHDDINKY